MPRVSIPDTNEHFEVLEGEVLYDSLHDRGLSLPHGCLSGSCGACKVEILSGKENLSPPTYVENDTIQAIKSEFIEIHGENYLVGKEIRLSCRARVMGDITFKPFK